MVWSFGEIQTWLPGDKPRSQAHVIQIEGIGSEELKPRSPPQRRVSILDDPSLARTPQQTVLTLPTWAKQFNPFICPTF
jgi:hypothetical protein